jgi:sugar/nucleoside kinase (ribokinase family)
VDDIGERKECYSQISQNLTLPKDNLTRFDGILINMISGYDISLPQLQKLRKNYDGLIYFDVHTFSRGVDKSLNRIFRRIENFNKWAECIDILQANESELLTLTDKKDEVQIIDELFFYGIQQVIITRAERGATVFIQENGIIRKHHKDALQVNLINKVGCGDVFGAVYFYNFIKNKNVTLAIEQANLFAGISTTYSDIKEFFNLKRDADKQIGKK